MKKIFASLLLVVSGLLATSAVAQNATGSSSQDWVGQHYGFTLGYVNGSPVHSWTGNPAINPKVDVSGLSLGLTYGRNYAHNKLVYGFEADINISNADGFELGSGTPCITPGEACNNELKGYATFRGRAGTPLPNGTLLFATAGLGVGSVSATGDTGACGGPCSVSDTRFGWTAGVGIERMLANGWNVNAEYLYMDFGDASMSGGFNTVTTEFKYSTLKLGFTKRF